VGGRGEAREEEEDPLLAVTKHGEGVNREGKVGKNRPGNRTLKRKIPRQLRLCSCGKSLEDVAEASFPFPARVFLRQYLPLPPLRLLPGLPGDGEGVERRQLLREEKEMNYEARKTFFRPPTAYAP